jgi:transposase
VDTLGLLLSVLVHPGSVQDRDGAKDLLERIEGEFPRIKTLWADAAYSGMFVDWLEKQLGWYLAVVRKAKGQTGFAVLPKRWIVERTFAWLDDNRLLSKEYERTPESSEANIYLAMTRLMLRRLAPS